MLNLKKTAVAVLALGSSAVFAGSMGPVCSAVNVTVPCESTAWDFGAKALYMQPSVNSNGGFGLDTTTSHNPNYNWGFQIEGSYHFNTGNDLNVNWYHLTKSSDRTFGPGPTVTGAFGTTSVTPVSAVASLDPKWDMVNIEFGQHVDFGDNKSVRFHGGGEYARLSNDVATSSVLTVKRPGVVASKVANATTYKPTYNGFGPRLGADMAYGFGNGLSVYANGATAMLAGTSSFTTSYTDTLGDFETVKHSRTTIVPEIDAKLGATYTYAMAQGDLTLDAGWMWVNYFNVHENNDSLRSDFGLQGPFIGLKWLGNVA